MPRDARSYIDLVRAEAGRLIESLPPVPTDLSARDAWAAGLRKQLWDVLGGRPAARKPHAESHGTFSWEGHSVERLTIDTEENLEVPALLIRPAGAEGPLPAVIAVDDRGKQAVRNWEVVPLLLERNVAVLALDVRGTGEVQVPENHCASDAIVLGRPLLAQQAWDIGCTVRCLAQRDDVDARRIALYGRGSAGTVATLAGALFDDVATVTAQESIASFRDAIADPLPQPLSIYAPRILEVADVPHLAACCPPGRFLWLAPVGTDKTCISEAVAAELQKHIGPGAKATVYREVPPAETIADFLSTP
jgi:hypothetical protein